MARARGLSIRDFAGRAGVAPGTIKRIFEMASPSVQGSTYRKVAEALGMSPLELDTVWRGASVPQQGRRGIPVINKAPAGIGEFTDMEFDRGVAAFDDTYLPASLCPGDDTAYATWVHGDSMMPEYRHGDLVVCSPREAIEGRVKDGDVVCVRLDSANDHENCIKRVYDRGAEVELVSDNRAYKPRLVKKESIVRMAKVWAKITFYS